MSESSPARKEMLKGLSGLLLMLAWTVMIIGTWALRALDSRPIWVCVMFAVLMSAILGPVTWLRWKHERNLRAQ